MFRNTFLATAIAGSLTALATTAHGASVSFNADNNWTKGTLSFTGTDGTNVTAKASLYDNALPDPTFYGDPYIASWAGSAGGIGICSGDQHVRTNTNRTASCYDNHQVDGYGSNEAVIVSFVGRQVELLSATFSYVGYNDGYEVFQQDGSGFDVGLNLPNKCWVCTVSNFDIGSDTSFAFGAYWSDDDWKLKALEYEVIPTPLPATGLMLIAGLGAFGFGRRRKTRS